MAQPARSNWTDRQRWWYEERIPQIEVIAYQEIAKYEQQFGKIETLHTPIAPIIESLWGLRYKYDDLRHYEVPEGTVGFLDHFMDILKFEKNKVSMFLIIHKLDGLPPFQETDKLDNKNITEATVGSLYPLVSKYTHIEHFNHNVEALVQQLQRGVIPQLHNKESTFVLFHVKPNLDLTILKVNQATKKLLEFCNGRHTVTDIILLLSSLYSVTDTGFEKLTISCLKILQELYRNDIIIFSDKVGAS